MGELLFIRKQNRLNLTKKEQLIKIMKNSNIKISMFKSFVFVFIVFLFLGTQSVYAQGSGSVFGTVVDKASGDPLPGVNVYFEGTSIGSATNFDGEYVIHQVPAGEYNIIAKYIGYKEQSLSITIVANKKVELNFEIDYLAFETGEVVVTAQALGQMGAINQQLNSNTIKNVVSQDRIQDVPDVNAAESVARLPGISLIRSGGEGQKVAIRGLSPKYNVMMVNGVRMQSTDRNDRSVDLNMIAPNILSGIEVTKALTADMDADAVGGTVNLRIGKAAEGFRGNFSAQYGYSSLADLYGNYRVNGLLSNRFFDNKLGIQLSGSVDKFNRNSDVLSAGYALNEENIVEDGFIPIDLSSATITDRVTTRKRLSGGLVLDYQFSNGSLILNNLISNLSQEQVEQKNSVAVGGNRYSGSAIDKEMSNAVFSNALHGEFDFSIFSMDFALSNSISEQYNPGDIRMNFGVAHGEAGFTTPTLQDPAKATPGEFINAVEMYEGVDQRVSSWSTLERDVTDAAQQANLNFEVPFNFSEKVSGNIKFGGKYIRNTRDNDETLHDRGHVSDSELLIEQMKDELWTDLGLENVDLNQGFRAFLFEDPAYDIGDFLSGEEGVDEFYYLMDIEKMRHFEELAQTTEYYPVAAKESFQYDYNYERNLSAFYTSIELNIGKYVTLFPGIRYENFKIDYNAYFTEKHGPNPEDFNNEELKADPNKGGNWFPQMHIRVKPTDWLDIRLASTKSIIYPDYRAISPYMFYDSYSSPSLSLGNTELEPALAQNYDIYASFHDDHVGLFTAGFFHKEIENLSVASSYKTKDSETINNRLELSQTQLTNVSTWINLDASTTVKGFELDWQTNFWYLPKFFKGIVLNVNYTHIFSETSYPFQTAVKQGDGPFAKTVFVDSTRTGRMPNQSDDVFNVTLGYDIGGFSARLSYVYQDNVLVGINRTYHELDAFTDAYKRWDFTAYQKIPKVEGLQVYLNVSNITNTPDRSYTSTLKKLSSVNYYGSTWDIGVRYKF